MRILVTAAVLCFGFAAGASAQPADAAGPLRIAPTAKISPSRGAHTLFAEPVRLGVGRFTASTSIPRVQTNDGTRPPLTMGGPRHRTAVVYAIVGALAGAYAGGHIGVRLGDKDGDSPGLAGFYAGLPVGAALGGCLGWQLGKLLER